MLLCVSAVQCLQLSFEVCMLTHRADSTNCTAYHEPALMRKLISAVSRSTSEMLHANSITKRTILYPALPFVQFQHQSNVTWTSILHIKYRVQNGRENQKLSQYLIICAKLTIFHEDITSEILGLTVATRNCFSNCSSTYCWCQGCSLGTQL